jgi:hypothetical protein
MSRDFFFVPALPGRPRGGHDARARKTRGSLRRTLGGAAGASGSHLSPSLHARRLGGGANEKSQRTGAQKKRRDPFAKGDAAILAD